MQDLLISEFVNEILGHHSENYIGFDIDFSPFFFFFYGVGGLGLKR